YADEREIAQTKLCQWSRPASLPIEVHSCRSTFCPEISTADRHVAASGENPDVESLLSHKRLAHPPALLRPGGSYMHPRFPGQMRAGPLAFCQPRPAAFRDPEDSHSCTWR